MDAYFDLLQEAGIDRRLLVLAQEVEEELWPLRHSIMLTIKRNELKVGQAFRKIGITDYHFTGSTGYGYGDLGRETLDRLFAQVFRAEEALVRPQFVSGTHTLAVGLMGLLEPGDELVFWGEPYPTLQDLATYLDRHRVTSRVVPFTTGADSVESLEAALRPQTRVLALQRSRGYSVHPGLLIDELQDIIAAAKKIKPDLICFVDNCYGEFVADREPLEVGADVIAGSLIKNPGGGLAPCGGYIAGRADLLTRIAAYYPAPGLGKEIGAWPGGYRLFYQGLFLAPHFVGQALQGAVFAARFWERLGFEVHPAYHEPRPDITQAVVLGTPERLTAFCQGIQAGSPINSQFVPEPGSLPGYSHQVVMAAGTFVQGASLELSADAPWEEPYIVYLQGGLSVTHTIVGNLAAGQEMLRRGLLP